MIVITSNKKFNKLFSKLPDKIKNKFKKRIEIFKISQSNRTLNNHKLTGKYEGCWSINVTGNYRAIYEILIKKRQEVYIFVAIGTHSELYE